MLALNMQHFPACLYLQYKRGVLLTCCLLPLQDEMPWALFGSSAHTLAWLQGLCRASVSHHTHLDCAHILSPGWFKTWFTAFPTTIYQVRVLLPSLYVFWEADYYYRFPLPRLPAARGCRDVVFAPVPDMPVYLLCGVWRIKPQGVPSVFLLPAFDMPAWQPAPTRVPRARLPTDLREVHFSIKDIAVTYTL